MGCGTSMNDNEVKSPNAKGGESRPDVSSQQPDNSGKFLSERKNMDLKEIKTEKSIMNPDSNGNGGVGKE